MNKKKTQSKNPNEKGNKKSWMTLKSEITEKLFNADLKKE